MKTPTTVNPFLMSKAAETELSTPPLIATTIDFFPEGVTSMDPTKPL
jgi:hypothetical protein